MKKFISILLLATYLFSTTQIGEIFKLPLLIAHFFQHHHHDHDIKLGDFVHDHYAHDSQHSSDHKEDSKLPFKTEYTSAFSAIAICTSALSISHPQIVFATERGDITIHLPMHYLTAFHSPIWQPPKTV